MLVKNIIKTSVLFIERVTAKAGEISPVLGPAILDTNCELNDSL